MATTFIYGLKDPNTEEIRYIGKSNNPDYRLSQHMSEREGNQRKIAWLRTLAESGLEPVLVVLQEVDDREWRDAEMEWIAEGRAQGWDLTNLHPGGDYYGNAEVNTIDFEMLGSYFNPQQIEKFVELPIERRDEVLYAMALSTLPHSSLFQRSCAYLGIGRDPMPQANGVLHAASVVGRVMLSGTERDRVDCLDYLEREAHKIVAVADDYLDRRYGKRVGRRDEITAGQMDT